MFRGFSIGLLTAVMLVSLACSTPKLPGKWSAIETGTGDAFYSINFVSENTGWLNGQADRSFRFLEEEENANVMKTAKVGKPGKKPEDPLKANQGFEVLRTTDGGHSWHPIPGLFENKIRSVWFVDQATGWALTIDRNILHTIDGGQSWAMQRRAGTVKLKLTGNRRQPIIDQPEQIEHVYFIDGQHGWAWGGGRKDEYSEQPGIFLITINGGQDWNEIAFPFEQSILSIFFLDADRAWANTIGNLYKTTDGGLNWSRIQTKLPEMQLDSIFFLDENNGWVVGHSGQMASTADGGRSWKRILLKEEFKMRKIVFTDRYHGWAVGDNGAIVYTPDGGQNWLGIQAPIPARLMDVTFVNGQIGWAAGLGGVVLKFEPSTAQ
jgi:photosystem II stability/assembly factor-like uncharacterized protein